MKPPPRSMALLIPLTAGLLIVAGCRAPTPPPVPPFPRNQPIGMVPASPSRPSLPPAPPLPPPAPIEVQHGEASWYSTQSNGGTRTASGETLRDDSFTAARRTLPFGTEVRVTNLRNQRSVVVRINDRGPFRPSRIVDVSLAAAQALQMVSAGVVPCTVEVLEPSG